MFKRDVIHRDKHEVKKIVLQSIMRLKSFKFYMISFDDTSKEH